MGTDDTLTPPTGMTSRKCGIAPGVLNTVEVPHDPQVADYSNWFQGQLNNITVPPAPPPIRQGNKVTALVNGQEAYAAMVAAIQTANSNSHFICMLNWFIDLSFELTPGNNLMALLTNAVSHGVQVRGMFWDQSVLTVFHTQNTAQVAQINGLQVLGSQPTLGCNGAAILDNNTLLVGSHHQKILVVNGANGLIGFCGGVDYNPDRIQSVSSQKGSPMHDVHCQIQGTAAWDLLNVFMQRWSDHPASAAIDAAKGPLRANTVGLPLPPDPGTQYVQIGRTFGNGSAHIGIKSQTGNSWYGFAPNGERTAESLIFNAVKQAKQFIYLQDQYLISMDASNALKAQLGSIQRLIILIPHPSLSDLPNCWSRQKAFLDNLGYNAQAAATNSKTKILVRYLKPAGATPDPKSVDPSSIATYVHSKMWIIDDKFAVIGSANCNNRGYNHDSEVVAGIYDSSQNTTCTSYFAHDLRVKLWALHLQVKPEQVFDPGSDSYWLTPAPSSMVAVFDQNAGTDSLLPQVGPPAAATPLGANAVALAQAGEIAYYLGTDPYGG